MKKTTLVFVLFMVALGSVIFTACPPPLPPINTNGMITGHVFAEIKGDGQERLRRILLPDVLVSVLDSLGNVVDTVRTDLDGSYKTGILKKGKYQLCFDKDGFNTTCHSVPIVWSSNHPGPLKIDLQSRNYLFGTALLKDGKPAVYRNAVFGVEFFTTVEAKLGGTVRTARANIAGEYLLSEVALGSVWQVKAQCQNAVKSQNFTNNGGPLNLTLPNSSPVIRGIAATNSSNQTVMRTAPGQKLTVRAVVEDPDSQPLNYIWVPMVNAPGSSFGSTNQVTWQLANLPGNYRLFMLVTDGFGGAAYQPYDIEAGDERVRFSGLVRDIGTSAPISGAQVRVNGQLAGTTDAKGLFKFTIPQAAQNRYVLNIEKVGYMLHSSIFFNDATGKEYSLVPSTLREFNPGTEIVFQETEDEYTRFSDDKVQPPFKRPPARVIIPANSIVDSAGNPVTTPVLMGLRNVDLFNERGLMPGDYGAVQGGVQKRLDSYGAIDVQIRDKANPNLRYKLSPSALAEVFIPIGSPLAASAPATTTFWDYNETSGLWEDIGTLTRVGDTYRGKTNKFSTLNADLQFNDATCIQLLDNPQNPVSLPANVTVSVPTGSAPKVMTYTISSSSDLPLVIVRLPANLVPPNGVTVEVTDASSTSQTQIVPTRNAIPGPASLAPNPPYDYCNDVYLFLPQMPANPGSVFLSRIETTDPNEATAYYQLIGAMDGGGAPTLNYATLNAWKAQQGFSGAGADAFRASYFNAGDLAFWRGMHQKNNAFYVSNFTRDFDSNDDVDGSNSPNAIATVAMEYSPISGSNPVTKFLVYAGNGQLITFADLDGYGPKFIPGLCIECHGGRELSPWVGTTAGDLENYYTANPDYEPKFLPFDLQSFIYSPALDRTTQEPEFTGLNDEVLNTNSNNVPEIQAFLFAAYGVTSTPLTGAFNDNSFPSSWSSTTPVNTVIPRDFYTQVVGPSCRGCHITRASQPLRFGSQANFLGFGGSVDFSVCTSSRYMPNAKVPFVKFWTSNAPSRPEELRKILGLPDCNH